MIYGLAAYLAGFIAVYSFRDQPWTYGRTQDVIRYLALWWFYALVWIFVPRRVRGQTGTVR